MQNEAYEKLELADVATIPDRVNPLLEGKIFDPVETTVMAANLPFYPGFRVLDIADYRIMPPVRRYVLYGPGEALVLDFTNSPIYGLNHRLPVSITEENVAEYVRFFFTFVRGRYGRFIITESVDDIAWKEEPPPTARRSVGNVIEPLSVMQIDKDGTFHLEARIMFRNTLFKSKIAVRKNGMVVVSDEEPLIEDMPVLDNIFGQ